MVNINLTFSLHRSRGCEKVVKITDNLEAQNTSSLKRAEEYLLTEKERLLLKFNDQHVLDSDDDKAKKYGLGSSDSDLLGEYHIDKDNERASAIRQTLKNMLNKRVKRPS